MKSIGCRELGLDCDFRADGETGEDALDALMHHVQADHDEDWFEIEEIYQAACIAIRRNVA